VGERGGGLLPVSQVIPFLWAMGDRYLYPILPGLIGGTILMLASLQARIPSPALRRATGSCAVAAALALALLFAVQARERTAIWRSHHLLYADSAAAYPDGRTAHYRAALDAVAAYDHPLALEHLEAAFERGIHFVQDVRNDRRLAPLHADPAFQALVEDMVHDSIRMLRSRTPLDAQDLSQIAAHHSSLGEYDAAIEALEEAMRIAGERRPDTFTQLSATRRLRAAAERAKEASP
jgi:tetratricopeptide (TPR) repeat protein